MVRKLYKHEFWALFKWIIPLNLFCLVLAIISRINLEFSDSEATNIAAAIMAFVFMLSVIALVAISFVIVIVRFYKNLLSHEGYLTFTVPVTPVTHIVCKLICGTAVLLMSSLVLGLSFGIIASEGISSSDLSEVFEAFEYIFGFDFSVIPLYRVVVLFVSYGILSVFSVMHGLLFIYAAMALGQRSRRNRVSWAVGWYFIISTIRSIITNVINGLLTYSGEHAYVEPVYDAGEMAMMAVDSLQITATFGIIENVIWGSIFFGITYYILTHKLNLE